jgi:hypothetical protein
MTPTEKLAPCPFCGVVPELTTTHKGVPFVCCANEDCHVNCATTGANLLSAAQAWDLRASTDRAYGMPSEEVSRARELAAAAEATVVRSDDSPSNHGKTLVCIRVDPKKLSFIGLNGAMDTILNLALSPQSTSEPVAISSRGGGESRPALSSTLAPQASAVADVVVHPAGVAPGPRGTGSGGEPTNVMPPEVQALIDAMWQLLDDMGPEGQGVCLQAKAEARIAFEPFREPDSPVPMSLDEARAVVDVIKRYGSSEPTASKTSGT